MLNPPSPSNPTPPPTVVNHLAMLERVADLIAQRAMHASPAQPLPPPRPSLYGPDNYPQTWGGVIVHFVAIAGGIMLLTLIFG